jgi:tetratricopeptide (TPR) repeat protein
MNAVISGAAGKALFSDGRSLKCFDIDDPSKLADCRQSDIPYLFGEARDLRVIENVELDLIVRELKSESDLSIALDLTLIALDAELDEDIRKDAIQDLDDLLADTELKERLESILYGRPVPDDGDLQGALRFCDKSRLANSFGFFQDLNRRQPLISKVNDAWEVIPTKIFGGHDERMNFQRVAVKRGLFRSLILTLETSQSFATFLLSAGLDDAIKQLHNYRQVLQVWSTPFREAVQSRIITTEIEDKREEVGTEHRRKRGRRVDIDRPAVLSEVHRRKEIISGAISRRDLEIVRELTDDLVEYQLRSGESKHLAKSLCDLAMEAKELGMFSLQLEFTERSINVAPADGWSWAQHGHALLKANRLVEAFAAYEQADSFGAGAVAKNGRAEVLKAQGRLDEALEAFNAVIEQHPEDVFAKNGRAEVLKAQGRLDEALEAFNAVIEQHPEDVVAKSGRAEVLKAQGRLDEALEAFSAVIEQHPEDVGAKNGRAEVLKAQGRLDEALEAFNAVIERHPEDVFAETGRAEVLKAQGRLEDALIAYSEITAKHPNDAVARNGRSCILASLHRFEEALEGLPALNPVGLEEWIGFHIRGVVLMRRRRIDEAVKIFQQGVDEAPFASCVPYFQASLAVALIRQEKYRDANRILSKIDNPNLQPQVETFRIHACGEEGEFEEASAAFEELTRRPWSVSDELLDELHRRYILKSPPKRSNDWVFDQEVGALLLVANQQSTISSYAH